MGSHILVDPEVSDPHPRRDRMPVASGLAKCAAWDNVHYGLGFIV